MEFVPVLAMGALVITIINLAKYIRSGNWNGTVTTLVVLAAGVFVVLLVGQTDFADGIIVAERPMSEYNNWSLLFIGLSLSSMAAFANDFRAAIDNTDSSLKPKLTTLDDTPPPE